MTRTSLLRDVVNTHHQSTPALLRRLGNISRQCIDTWKPTAHSLSRSNSSPTGALRLLCIRKHYNSRSESKVSFLSGAKSFTHFGEPDLQSPSQHTKQDFDIIKYSNFPPDLKQSSAGSWVTVIVVAVISGATLYSISPNKHKRHHERTKEFEEEIEFEKDIINSDNMAAEALPGRPGTLTPREEEKLKEFWAATLQVFGVLDLKELNGHASRERSDSKISDKKPKKKRMSLFRSKNKDDDTASTTSTESGAQTPSGEDDKYGQTKEFHEALANLSPETLRATFWSMVKHDHPDGLLLRFLRARKWDVEKALVMMVSTMRWRSSDMHVDDDIMRNGEMKAFEDAQGSDPAKKKLGEDFLEQMRLGKSFLHGLDNQGRPMCFVRVRLHRQGEQSEESLERYTVFVIESARMILSPPVDTACVVFDMTNFSMANMDYAPVKFMIKCFEANYPESLGVVLVHKAPWIFQGIWKIIKGWLDPVVASKVHFTNDHEMEDFVPKSQIIKELNGAEDWEYEYIEPVPGENDKMKDLETRDRLLEERKGIVDEYEKATVEWIKGGDALTLKTKRNELAIQLRDDYWRLDPYIRARSYYDRCGLINSGGKLQFYPGKMITPEPVATKTEAPPTSPEPASAATTNGGPTPHQHSADDVD